MLEGSRFHEDLKSRPLRGEERALLEMMLDNHSSLDFDSLRVVDANDGGMGSIHFLEQGMPRKTSEIPVSEAEYVDSDGVLVSITLNVDGKYHVSGLDFWKVDFTSLRQYPRPEKVQLKAKA